jgi:hypothetical protein
MGLPFPVQIAARGGAQMRIAAAQHINKEW